MIQFKPTPEQLAKAQADMNADKTNTMTAHKSST